MIQLSISLMAIMGLLAAPNDGRFSRRSNLWERSEQDVLRGFRNMYNPHVIYEPGTEYPFRMWFFGWASEDCNPGYSGCDAIYFARGKRLDEWDVWSGGDEWDSTMTPQRWLPVICAQDQPWDQWHNGDPSVVLHEGTYYMAYSATGFDLDGLPFGQQGDTDGDLCCIMGAISRDGIQWVKSEKPILIYEPEIGRPGDPNYYDAVGGGMYHRPSLMHEDGKWRLWFDYWASNERGTCMGYAENEGEFLDPSDWRVVRAGNEPLLVG
ncbi:MAG: hypothetical protein ACUVX8_17200 [Candidatus Zipacnadales bacterium]